MIPNRGRTLEDDFPALFRAADRLSVRGQKNRRGFFVCFLLIDLAASILTEFRDQSPFVSALILLVVILGLLATILLLQEGPENDWYGGRALAESVKTISWRYMMCADPFPHGLSLNEAENRLLSEINELQRANHGLLGGLFVESATDLQITERMRAFRSMEVRERKSQYLELRIRNQQGWYREKAKSARAWLQFCRWALVTFQLVIVIIALSLVMFPHQHFSAIGLFSAFGASLLAWQELNQFGGIAIAYNLAAHDLASIQSKAGIVNTEGELGLFVLNAERAISREHTLWLARRTR
ncbi:MAG: DUF4231 domain-containing protein [Terracidiphilus sp.]|nr:DUF4231 domain-containing protein [Terracidiphilus sp.]